MAKLLVMEDDTVVSFRMKMGLEEAGHDVDVCTNASSGIEQLWHTAYDLLISDIIVREDGQASPDGGFKLVSWVRSNPKTSKMPIIAVTGSHRLPGMSHMLSAAEQLGANASLEKPYNMVELLDLISRLLTPRTTSSEDAVPT